jgi:hypothetical protein
VGVFACALGVGVFVLTGVGVGVFVLTGVGVGVLVLTGVGVGVLVGAGVGVLAGVALGLGAVVITVTVTGVMVPTKFVVWLATDTVVPLANEMLAVPGALALKVTWAIRPEEVTGWGPEASIVQPTTIIAVPVPTDPFIRTLGKSCAA